MLECKTKANFKFFEALSEVTNTFVCNGYIGANAKSINLLGEKVKVFGFISFWNV